MFVVVTFALAVISCREAQSGQPAVQSYPDPEDADYAHIQYDDFLINAPDTIHDPALSEWIQVGAQAKLDLEADVPKCFAENVLTFDNISQLQALHDEDQSDKNFHVQVELGEYQIVQKELMHDFNVIVAEECPQIDPAFYKDAPELNDYSTNANEISASLQNVIEPITHAPFTDDEVVSLMSGNAGIGVNKDFRIRYRNPDQQEPDRSWLSPKEMRAIKSPKLAGYESGVSTRSSHYVSENTRDLSWMLAIAAATTLNFALMAWNDYSCPDDCS